MRIAPVLQHRSWGQDGGGKGEGGGEEAVATSLSDARSLMPCAYVAAQGWGAGVGDRGRKGGAEGQWQRHCLMNGDRVFCIAPALLHRLGVQG